MNGLSVAIRCFLPLILLLAGLPLLGQAFPYELELITHGDSLSHYAYGVLALDGADNAFVASRIYSQEPLITRYNLALDSLSAFSLPPVGYAYSSQDGDLCGLTDGGCVFITSRRDAPDSLRPFIVRLNTVGDTLWTKQIDDFGEASGTHIANRGNDLYAVIQDTLQPILMRLDAAGDTVWTRRVNSSSMIAATELITLGDNLVLVDAHTTDDPNLDAALAAFDAAGDSLWSLTVQTVYDDYSRCLFPLPDDRFIWVVNQYSDALDIFMPVAYCYDSLGEFQWMRYHQGIGSDYVWNGMAGADGYIYLGGSTSEAGDVSGLLWCLDMQGTSRWSNSYAFNDWSKFIGLQWSSGNLLYTAIRTLTSQGDTNFLLAVYVPLYADFTAEPDFGHAPIETIFTATATGPVQEYRWDFTGDGVFDAFGSATSWTYNQPGIFAVTLEVEGEGHTNSYTCEDCVLVWENLPPVIESWEPEQTAFTLSQGAQQTFTVNAYDPDTPFGYSWLLDGASTGQTEADFTHTFSDLGDVAVTCLVADTQTELEVTWNVEVAMSTEEMSVPAGLALHLPNPLRLGAGISFSLPLPGAVSLELFDIRGRRVRRLLSGTMPTGSHLLHWDGRDDNGRYCASGVYLLRLTAPRGMLTRRVVLLK
ncbi:MAG: PKD domain-containing protein [Candidatus Cloacimonetes bacterium]|nr:PKD domain-containing protein [Candidatus Cloacimonadota bacterium]